MKDTAPEKPKEEPTLPAVINIWGLVGEIGFILALPLVVAILAGIKLDKYFHTLPLFIIVGMILSIATSSILIWRKLKTLL